MTEFFQDADFAGGDSFDFIGTPFEPTFADIKNTPPPTRPDGESNRRTEIILTPEQQDDNGTFDSGGTDFGDLF